MRYAYDSGQKKQSNALVILDKRSIADFNSTIKKIESIGIKAYHRFPPKAFIGYVSFNSEKKLLSLFPNTKIFRKEASEKAYRNIDDQELNIAIKIWNLNYCKKKNDSIFSIEEDKGNLLTSDIAPKVYSKKNSTSTLTYNSANSSSDSPYIPYGATDNDTSEFMLGSIAIGVILPESDGHTEDWTQAEIDKVITSVQEGIDWWIQQAPDKSNLSFTYDFNIKVPTPEEPKFSEYNKFINGYKIMNSLGYEGSSADDFDSQVRQFDNDLRHKYETNWAVTVFYIDRSRGKGGVSYAMPGGPYVVIFSERNSLILTEEIRRDLAFVFYAEYENVGIYNTKGYCEWRSGYLKVENGNAYGCGIDNCIMYSAVRPYVCIYTQGHIGIRDSDGDSIPDILDTFPSINITPLANTIFTNPSISVSGTAKVSPLIVTNKNPGQLEENKIITINTISSVEYKIDNGSWLKASSYDGKFNGYIEGFTISTPNLSNGTHTISIRAENSVGNKTSPAESFNFVISSTNAVLSVSPLGLDFEYVKGNQSTAGQQLKISFNGNQGYDWVANHSSTFLNLNQSSGTGEAIITASVDAEVLTPGIYTDTIEISSSQLNSFQNIPITLNVYGETVITTNIHKIEISDYLWSKEHSELLNPPYQKLEIKNLGGKTVEWASEIDFKSPNIVFYPYWINLYPSKGTTPSSVFIMLDKTNLPPQDCTADIHIKSPTGEFPEVVIPVTFSLCALPSIKEITPISGNPGDLITIKGKDLTNSYVEGNLWFKVKKEKVLITPNSWNDYSITFYLPEVSGRGFFRIKNDCGLSNPSSFFLANPNEIPEIESDKQKLDIIVYNDDSRVVTETLMITNTNGGILDWEVVSDVGWATFQPSSGTGNKEIKAVMDFTGFSYGNYTANFIIRSPSSNAKNQIKIPVNVEISTNNRPLKIGPEITSLSPSSAKYMDEVILYGMRFGDGNYSKVFINDIQCYIVDWKDNTIHLKIPWGIPAGSADISVSTPKGKSNPKKIAIIPVIPQIKDISPKRSKAGSILLLTGNYFGEKEGKLKTKRSTAHIIGWTNNKIYFYLTITNHKKTLKDFMKIKTIYGKSNKYRFKLRRKRSKYKIIPLSQKTNRMD
ncbi:MAG: hypothetical protein D6734_05950 [Candidatus Schekmanbacteria bacterium]|nr:MAG: hypothetical protein D6734_05950 [Candidatus Schekmanbacteria bacterium]